MQNIREVMVLMRVAIGPDTDAPKLIELGQTGPLTPDQFLSAATQARELVEHSAEVVA